MIDMQGAAIPRLASGEAALKLVGIQGSEALSLVYLYSLDCVSATNDSASPGEMANLDLGGMIGRELTVFIGIESVRPVPQSVRQISGIITEARFLGAGERFCRYQLSMRPWLHLAEHRTDYRIFQNESVVDIVLGVFQRYGRPCQLRLRSHYPALDYQVQYGETDFAFAQRLMQEHGIYWFFEHCDGAHHLVLADEPGAHFPCSLHKGSALPYHPDSSTNDQEHVNSFSVSRKLHSSSWTSSDFNFEAPLMPLDVEARAFADPCSGDALQQYVWPGDHASLEQGQRLADVRMQEVSSRNGRFHGTGPLRSIVCGTTFALEGFAHRSANRDYLVVEASLEIQTASPVSGEGDWNLRCSFVVQAANLQYRAPHDIPRPRTTGPQTATVTGPSGHEIWTDQYGRVKLRFHWDRSGITDHNSSCWVRVAFPWAGNQYGSVAIPRVGSEVIVDFENGDPDRPIVIGRVYNAANMPPWLLPHNATQSGTFSRSTPGGYYELANAIRFEDRAGAEQLWIHAQRDLLGEVEHCEVHCVGADRVRTTGGNDTTSIGGARTVSVLGVEQHVVNGAQLTMLNDGQSLTVNGAQNVSVSGGQSTSVGGSVTITAGTQMSFVCGAASIVMESGGTVTISGVNVNVVASGTLVTEAPMTDFKSA